jgi:ATP-dependent exoDNAse (exonuclease V) alpha subunit
MKQLTALSILKAGKNVFLTGSAGAGKTYTLNQYIRYLKDRKIPVAVTASTGIAATHLNGITIHAWAGFGVRKSMDKKDLEALKDKKHIREHLENSKVLVIDEISMMHRCQLDMVNQVLKYFKQNDLPFGGIQVIFCGDFFQLPPVGDQEESNRDKFAFMSKAWLEAAPVICYISEQHRQKDNSLDMILNEIRKGEVSNHALSLLKKASETRLEKAPKLYTHNYDVESINRAEMSKLKSQPRYFDAETKGNAKLLEMLKSNVRTDARLELRLGAKVMFIKNNFEKGYINGSLGEVVDFTNEGMPVVDLSDGKRIYCEKEKWAIEDEVGKALASFEQFPLRAAWAITVHKSQGMTLDSAEIDLRNTFEKGQGYVAISRVKSLEGLCLIGFNNTALELDTLAMKADKRFRELAAEAEAGFDAAVLEREATAFVRNCGGLLDEKEIDKQRKKINAGVKKEPKKSTYLLTKELIDQGMNLEEIAEERELSITTIIGHLDKIKDQYPDTDIHKFRPKGSLIKKVEKALHDLILNNVEGAIGEDGKPSMKMIHDALQGKVDWADLRLAMIFVV